MSRRFYCITFAMLLAAEVLIALYVRDAFVRPYAADRLRGRLFGRRPNDVPTYARVIRLRRTTARGRLAATYDQLGLPPGSALRVILGSSFDWKDLLCYLAGGLLLTGWELILHGLGRNAKRA